MKYKKVAQWLYDEIIARGTVYQENAVRQVAELFGSEYTYLNENHNPAISTEVYEEFKQLKQLDDGHDIEWDKGNKFWHEVGSGGLLEDANGNTLLEQNDVGLFALQQADLYKIMEVQDTDLSELIQDNSDMLETINNHDNNIDLGSQQ
jgi:hypothetical protein